MVVRDARWATEASSGSALLVSLGVCFWPRAGRVNGRSVFVFRKGSWKDQALSASALLQQMGYSPEMRVTADGAFVALGDGTVYSVLARLLKSPRR